MLGLFAYSYDYYEWEYLIAVSEDEGKLIEKGKELPEGEYRLLTQGMDEEHNHLRDEEIPHLMIKSVEVL